VRRIEAEVMPPPGALTAGATWIAGELEPSLIPARFDANAPTVPAFVSGRENPSELFPEFDSYATRISSMDHWTLEAAPPNVPELGDRSYFYSDVDSVAIDPTRIEFIFAPSPGLPSGQTSFADVTPGRYYLLVNTSRYNPVTGQMEPTVTDLNQIRFAITTAGRTDNILDLTGPIPWRTDYVVGYRPANTATGNMATGW